MSWPYLESELFQSRYVLAAYFLRGIPLVVELGGHKTPITGFLGPGQVGISIDPLLESGAVGRHFHLAGRFPDVQFPIPVRGPYGVVILGLELHLADDGWAKLYELLRGAARIVLGEPKHFPTSARQIVQIRENVPLREVLTVGVDLRGNMGCGDYAERRLHVYEPR